MRFWRFCKGFFLSEIREFEVVFWSIVFPLLLYFFLSTIFGSEGKTSGISFKLAVLRSGGQTTELVVADKTVEAISGKDGPFKATSFADIEAALSAMKQGKQDAVLEIGSVAASTPPGGSVTIHCISGRESSQVAGNILQIAFDKANIEVARDSDPQFRSIPSEAIPVQNTASGRSVDYKDYIFPSVALMMMLSVALFNSPLSLSFYRSSGTNKKLFTTPLRPLEYFGAHLVKLLSTIMISLVLLYLMAFFIYRVRSGIFSPGFFMALVLAMLTFVSFGLMVASFARKESSAGIMGQVFYQTMMFLGGFFFPVFGVTWGIRWLVYVLPSTYLVELLRRGMGIQSAPIGMFWLIAIPMLWLVVSAGVFTLNFRKVMGNE